MNRRATARRILLTRILGLVGVAIIVTLLVIVNSKMAPRSITEREPSTHHHHGGDGLSREETAPMVAEYRSKLAVIKTDFGTITFKFCPEDAPRTVDNFAQLAQKGFYNGSPFHRIVKDSLIQGGSPDGSPSGGPGYTIPAEFNKRMHVEGTVAMARAADPNSAGSQFYICLREIPQLDGRYTVFGQVTEGMDVVRKIAQSETDSNEKPLVRIVMREVTIEDFSGSTVPQ